MTVYYNEIDPFAANWLREIIKEGLIPDGEVDTRSIVDVSPDDLRHFTQCHFFAGIGGWSHALRLAGWPDDRPIWTGSCPCQPISAAGKKLAENDPRHLWPDLFRLVRTCRPPVIMGEQVAETLGYRWFDGVQSDLEGEGYASEAVDIPALSINAPHVRSRLYWVAQNMADSNSIGTVRSGGKKRITDAGSPQSVVVCPELFWQDAGWITDATGKSRRIKPGVRLLAHGVPNRMALLRGFGNAVVPPLAAEVIKAFMDVAADTPQPPH